MSLRPCRIAASLRQVCTALLKGYCLQLRVAESPFRLVPPGQSHTFCFLSTWLHMYLYTYIFICVCVHTCLYVDIFIYTYHFYDVYYHVMSLSYFDFDFSYCDYYHSFISKYSYMSMFPLKTLNMLQVIAHKGLFMSKSKMLFQVLPAIFVMNPFAKMTWSEGLLGPKVYVEPRPLQ